MGWEWWKARRDVLTCWSVVGVEPLVAGVEKGFVVVSFKETRDGWEVAYFPSFL